MSFVERDGAAIWYDVQGDGEAVTLVGGDIMASDQFHYVFPALVKRHKVVRWDFRNIGNSERKPSKMDFTIDEKVEDMKAALDDAGIEKTHIWSIATGGFTGVVFAARYPERVASLIHYGQCQPSEGGLRAFKVLDLIHKEYDWPTACEHMVHFYSPSPEYMDWTVSVYVKNADPSWMKMYWHELNADITDDMRATTCPMLVMLGAKGPLGANTSYGSGFEITKECRPEAKLEIVDGGTGTYYMVDQADEAATKAMAFFERNPIS